MDLRKKARSPFLTFLNFLAENLTRKVVRYEPSLHEGHQEVADLGPHDNQLNPGYLHPYDPKIGGQNIETEITRAKIWRVKNMEGIFLSRYKIDQTD